MTAIGLTPRQSDAFAYIVFFKAEHGVMPTIRQIAAGIGLKSPSGAYQLLDALEERGHIRRLHNRARAIAIIHQPGA